MYDKELLIFKNKALTAAITSDVIDLGADINNGPEAALPRHHADRRDRIGGRYRYLQSSGIRRQLHLYNCGQHWRIDCKDHGLWRGNSAPCQVQALSARDHSSVLYSSDSR